MEVAAEKAGPTTGVEGDPPSGPTDVAGEHTVGRTSDPWRAFEAWLFHLPGRRLGIHGPLPIAANAVVADIPYKSRRLPGVDRFLRGPHGHVPPPVWVHRAPPRAPPDRAFRCNGEPDDGVGRTADPRGIPVGHGAAVPDPRPGRRIRAIVPLDRDGDGRGRGRYGATEPVAKSVCGTPDRQREARMPGPFDHPQRAAFARILGSYLDYYHGSRTHLSLGKDTPDGRPVQPAGSGTVVSLPKVGGLHHRYERLAA